VGSGEINKRVRHEDYKDTAKPYDREKGGRNPVPQTGEKLGQVTKLKRKGATGNGWWPSGKRKNEAVSQQAT